MLGILLPSTNATNKDRTSKQYYKDNLTGCMRLLFTNSLIFLVLIITFSWNVSIVAASSNHTVFTKDSAPYGSPYREWIGKWWTWWLGIPNDLHPTNNYSDSKRCATMQNGPVWFLPDIIPGIGEVQINCIIPPDKAILLPLTTTICEKSGEPMPDIQLAECADNILTPVNNIMVSVDGKKVDVSRSYDKSDFFNVTFPEDPVAFWGEIQPGTYRGIATGYFLFLSDLAQGQHIIDMKVVDLLKGNEGPPPKFDPPREATFRISIQ